jgi:urease accessory protein UreH
MPGASKFYRSSGPQARLNQHFYLDEDATLEWLPQDTIIFPGANAALRSVFHLKASSTLLAWELYCLGRPVIGETFSHGTLESRLEVWVDDEPRLIERQHLSDGDLTPVAGHPWLGTLLFYPASEEHLETVRERLARWTILPAPRSPTACCRCVFSPRQPDLPAGDARYLAVASPASHHQNRLFAAYLADIRETLWN